MEVSVSVQRQTGRPRTKNGEPAPQARRSIFRSEALQHYRENREKVELPPLASPRVYIYLWLLAGLTMAAGLLLACWPWIGPVVVGAA
jgi:hypothetical protein